MSNGQLLDAAERHGFNILITGDTNMRFQQNMWHRKIAIIVLSPSKWPDVKAAVQQILDALQNAKSGTCTLVECVQG